MFIPQPMGLCMPGTREQVPGLRCCCWFCVGLGYFSLVLELKLGNIPRSFLLASGAQEAALGVLQTLGWGAWGRGSQRAACPWGEGAERSGTAPQDCHTGTEGQKRCGCLRYKNHPKERFFGNPAGNGQDMEAAGSGRCRRTASPGKTHAGCKSQGNVLDGAPRARARGSRARPGPRQRERAWRVPHLQRPPAHAHTRESRGGVSERARPRPRRCACPSAPMVPRAPRGF